MRVLIVTETLVPGGAETFAVRLTDELRKLHCQSDLLVLNGDRIDQRLLEQSRVEPLVVRFASLPVLRRIDGALRRLAVPLSMQRRRTAWFLRDQLKRYDVIHTNLIGADLLFAEIKRRHPHLRIVSTLHGDYALHELAVASGAEQRLSQTWVRDKAVLLGAVDRWAYIAEQQRQFMIERLGISQSRLTLIRNGFQPSPEALAARQDRRVGQPFTFAMAARGSIPEKGWSVLIQAFQSLPGDVRLLLIGAGDHLDALRRAHGADSRIHFAGFAADPARLVAGADVFVLPTTYPAESLPTVVIEALSVGVPVIATEVGDIRDMLTTPTGEVAGTILPVVDGRVSADLLAEAMKNYLDDRASLRSAAAAAAGAFEKFDMSRCAAAYLRLYEAVTRVSSTGLQSPETTVPSPQHD